MKITKRETLTILDALRMKYERYSNRYNVETDDIKRTIDILVGVLLMEHIGEKRKESLKITFNELVNTKTRKETVVDWTKFDENKETVLDWSKLDEDEEYEINFNDIFNEPDENLRCAEKSVNTTAYDGENEIIALLDFDSDPMTWKYRTASEIVNMLTLYPRFNAKKIGRALKSLSRKDNRIKIKKSKNIRRYLTPSNLKKSQNIRMSKTLT